MNELRVCAESVCHDCGQSVAHHSDGRMRRHGCRFRLLARVRHTARRSGWLEGYQFDRDTTSR